jgi:hypothetical protein
LLLASGVVNGLLLETMMYFTEKTDPRKRLPISGNGYPGEKRKKNITNSI